MKLEIAATADFIEIGIPESCSRCPIALGTIDAAHRQGHAIDPESVSVENDQIRFRDTEGFDWKAEISDDMGRFINDFDQHLPVSPFVEAIEFQIDDE